MGNFSESLIAYEKTLEASERAAAAVAKRNGGFSATRCHILCLVAQFPGITYGELSKKLRLPKYRTQRECMDLAQDFGYLEFVQEGKILHVNLTQSGADRHRRIVANK